MPLRVTQAQEEDRGTIASLAQFYLHDLSEFSGTEPLDGVLYELPEWAILPYQESNFLSLITLRDKPAGFARIISSDSPKTLELTDFFLLRCYRQLGIGEEALYQLLYQHPGKWSITVSDLNQGAQGFFRTVLKRNFGKKCFELNKPGSDSITFEFSTESVPNLR